MTRLFTTTRRTRRALVPVLAASALLTLGTAGPAAADSDQLWTYSDPYELILPGAYEDGSAPERTVALQVSHDNIANPVGTGHLTVDAGELAAFVKITWPANCAADTSVTAVCDIPSLTGTDRVTAAELKVSALPDAPDGAVGTLRYTAVAGDMTSYPGETRVTVGNGPDLALSQSPRQDGVTPGTLISAPATLSNNGNRTAEGVLLRLSASRGLAYTERPANCEYLDTEVSTQALCVLDETLAPGDSITLANPLKARRNALYERYDYSVEPYSAEALEAARAGRTYTPGTGAELDPAPAQTPRTATATAAVPDLDPQDNSRSVIIHATNTADLRLIGSRVEGAVGETVRADITVKNRGPAWVASLGAGEPVATVDVRIPAGATVTARPDDCYALTADGEWVEEQLGAPRYRCTTPIYLNERATHTFPFDLRIDSATRSTASVAIDNDQYEPPIRAYDPDLTNNSARNVVNG
ncbi:hypothetical protein NFX46_38745 [Streptomyces phaeoluteigriseus]|uniref:DUF11 domain-containing protein n=1 Tax=Streptomyces phaeoluteigriseus TaxID=114686 RepID=A0ABY4ZKX3_9ACTN|nr:hypothetical protein [Streptomyces phaeoluteigriseus]USQ89165.1 hypothetical protein NFX46_38745 [Streptomyces phaeoluteigriseus]